jgi:Ca2+-binding RTX toxin-like protein
VCAGLVLALSLPAAAGAQEPFRIAFERVGVQSDIWLIYSDGTGEQRLTSAATPDATPAWSPDGSTIVYACAPSNRNWDLCSINVDTREVTQLTNTPTDEFDPQFTRDGSQIVFETYPTHRAADLAIMSADGGDATPLASTPRVNDQDPSPDPNSSRVAFSANGSIQTLDTESPGQTTTVTSGNRNDSDPSFSTTGDIAFRRLSGRSYDLFVATGGSEGAIESTTSGKADDLEPAFTGDGAQVAFVRRTDPSSGFQIFAMTAQGQNQQAVTKASTTYDDLEPAPEPPGAAAARAWSAFPAANLAASCKINGTGAGETINGNSKRNCIYAKGGNDKVNAKGGNDKVVGGPGLDTLNGGTGNDYFDALDGQHDVVDGGSGANQGLFDGIDTGTNVPGL